MARKWFAVAGAIAAIWIAVILIAALTPSLETTSAAGATTVVPVTGIVAAVAAFIATIVLAVVGFGSHVDEAEAEKMQLAQEQLEARVSELEARTAAPEHLPSSEPPLVGSGVPS